MSETIENVFKTSSIDELNARVDELEKRFGVHDHDGRNSLEVSRLANPNTSASISVYTSDDTWSKQSGLAYIDVEVVGGGGGGGSEASVDPEGGSGGGGGYSRKLIDASDLGATETVTVGAAGAYVEWDIGTAGGTSSFGSHLSATGGSPGDTGPGALGGAGGTGSDGDINSGGTDGSQSRSAEMRIPGNGGSCLLGGGGTGGDNAHGSDGSLYGGGGGGCAGSGTTDRHGGNGAQGVVIVREYYN